MNFPLKVTITNTIANPSATTTMYTCTVDGGWLTRKCLAVFLSVYLRVTNSSEEVGWIATQLSKSALVAPILIATANPCSSSSDPIPMTCRPTTYMYGNREQVGTLVIILFVSGFAHVHKFHFKWEQHTQKKQISMHRKCRNFRWGQIFMAKQHPQKFVLTKN